MCDFTEPVTVSDLYAISPGQLVTVTAKVTHMTGSKFIKMDNASLKQSRAILLDPTGSSDDLSPRWHADVANFACQ